MHCVETYDVWVFFGKNARHVHGAEGKFRSARRAPTGGRPCADALSGRVVRSDSLVSWHGMDSGRDRRDRYEQRSVLSERHRSIPCDEAFRRGHGERFVRAYGNSGLGSRAARRPHFRFHPVRCLFHGRGGSPVRDAPCRALSDRLAGRNPRQRVSL